jgi:hypothetical protein
MIATRFALPAILIAALAAPAIADKDVATTQLAALHTAAHCDDKASVWRPWCIAADFASGKPAALPKGKTLVGLTIQLETGKDVGQALSDKVNLVALVIDAKGKAKLTDITPSNDSEQQPLAEAVAEVALVFKGKAATAKLSTDLSGYLKTLTGKYPAKKAAKEWTWKGANPTRLRKVGDVWVAIETAPNGIWASIFTDAWE